jgi:KDO2-lipid IV(A) lauroyltransferase
MNCMKPTIYALFLAFLSLTCLQARGNEGLEFFDRAYKKCDGLIGVTGHIGNFELLAVHIQSLGYNIAVIGRELYDKKIDKLLIENREAMGLTNISTSDSPKVILKWLKSGHALGVLMDNDSFRVRSMFVPFFGRMANTPVGQSVLGLKTGAAFIPMACIRTEKNRYKIIIKPEVIISRTDDFVSDVLEMTRLCSLEIEAIIREYPDQWAWVHNRWHTRKQESLDNSTI